MADQAAKAREERQECAARLSKARQEMVSLNQQATAELNPLQAAVERTKAMRAELAKVPKDEVPTSERDTLDRELKEELVQHEKAYKDRKADWQARYDVEKADADKAEADLKRLDARIELYERIAEVTSGTKRAKKAAK